MPARLVRPRAQTLGAFVVGLLAGAASSSPLHTGPPTAGIFAVSGLGYLMSLAVSAVVYAVVTARGRTA